MKYIILLGDGMADMPLDSLGGKTPLEYAKTPNMDSIAQNGICGMARTVPEGMHPGSDTANLSVFGYNPTEFYTGRAPLEALSMGISLGKQDAAFRCNIVNTENGIMKDFNAGQIDTALTEIVIKEVAAYIRSHPGIELYSGVSYRNIMVWRDYPYGALTETTPPHDITGQETARCLPQGAGAELLLEIMDISKSVIAASDAIKGGMKKYRGIPESLWLWGGGFKPSIKPLNERFGFKGFTISAVDLIHGIGLAAGLSPCRVEGATGYLDTNYEGKAAAAFDCLEKGNFVYLHVEAPDESGHEGNVNNKIRAIEDFDKRVVGPVLEGLKRFKNHTVLAMPDHPTPVSILTHSGDPVPFCMFRTAGWNDANLRATAAPSYSEITAAKTGLFISEGYKLIELMIDGKL
ncbi:MAG: cofactor-independent phosphoglycerate mutase [Leptospirales bacterium]|nr:cofactor-independent phosphoglycerate mutase [Leptospirales bacterium]